MLEGIFVSSSLTRENYSKTSFGLYTNVLKLLSTWIWNTAHCPKSSYGEQDIICLSGNFSLGSQTEFLKNVLTV